MEAAPSSDAADLHRAILSLERIESRLLRLCPHLAHAPLPPRLRELFAAEADRTRERIRLLEPTIESLGLDVQPTAPAHDPYGDVEDLLVRARSGGCADGALLRALTACMHDGITLYSRCRWHALCMRDGDLADILHRNLVEMLWIEAQCAAAMRSATQEGWP